MSAVIKVWERLKIDGDSDQFVRLRLPDVAACAVYAARHVGDGNEALMLEVATTALPPLWDYPQSAGFHVVVQTISPGRSGRTRLLLVLTNARYRDVFRSLAEDVIYSLTSASDEPDAVRTFVSRLARWQAFLQRHSPGGLPLEARRGLYGELAFLRDHLSGVVSDIAAVRAWTGCRGATHDFQLLGGSVEVKTTSANPPTSFHISNAGQLDGSGLPALFVCLIAVEEATGAMESLPEMVDSLRLRIDGHALEQFDEALVDSGFLTAHRDLYTSPRYSLRSMRFFRVTRDFPRIEIAALPDGIDNVQYIVNVGACSPFEVTSSELLETILLETNANE